MKINFEFKKEPKEEFRHFVNIRVKREIRNSLEENIGDLEDIIKLCDKKYGSQFNKKLFLEQLIYLDDIKDEEIRFLKAKVTKKQVEDFLRKEVSKIEFR